MPTCSESRPTGDDVHRFTVHVSHQGLSRRQQVISTRPARSLVVHRPDLPTRERLQGWIQAMVRKSRSLRRARERVSAALPFLEFCGIPDLREMLEQVRSCMHLVRALAQPGATWDQAFRAALKPHFESGLAGWLEAFLRHWTGRQMKVGSWPCQLRRLDRLAVRYGVESPEQLTPAILEDFLTENRPGPSTRNTRLSKLRVLQRFLEPRGAQLHLPAGLAVPVPAFRPHLFTLCEIGRLLQAMRQRGIRSGSFRWLGLENIVFLLYACGMRLREPLGLRLRDVDLEQGALFVHCTKFYKQRWVPLGQAAVLRLKTYQTARQAAFPALEAPDELFFLNARGTSFKKGYVEGHFVTVLTETQIVSRGTRRPRLHDLRHTLAVHRLYQWYAEEADVQNKLPLLSAYLGHDRLHHTEAYLHLTEDLIRQAGRNFQRSFEQVVGRTNLHG